MNRRTKTILIIALVFSILNTGIILLVMRMKMREEAKAPETINLTVKEALAQRHSIRSYTDKALTEDQVLELLWAANGVSREDGRRTAPSAINAQDVELYVCSAQGASHYEAKNAKLVKVTDEDIRPYFRSFNKFIDQCPLTVLVVTDLNCFGTAIPEEKILNYGLLDAGIVSENISLYCTSQGLGTVCCAPGMKTDSIQSALHLNAKQIPVLYHPVGYPAE